MVKAERGNQYYTLKFISNIFESESKTRSFIREISILRQLTQMQQKGAFPHSVAIHDAILFNWDG